MLAILNYLKTDRKKIYRSILIFLTAVYCYFSYVCFFGSQSYFHYNLEIHSTAVVLIALVDWLLARMDDVKYDEFNDTICIKFSLGLVILIIMSGSNSPSIIDVSVIQQFTPLLSFIIGLGALTRRIMLVSLSKSRCK